LATALYYPFIHFKDDSWPKLSALYWDRMARIVPKSYRQRGDGEHALERDSETTRRLADEADFIRNLSPSEVTYPVSLCSSGCSRGMPRSCARATTCARAMSGASIRLQPRSRSSATRI